MSFPGLAEGGAGWLRLLAAERGEDAAESSRSPAARFKPGTPNIQPSTCATVRSADGAVIDPDQRRRPHLGSERV
jgi:hypothetical protein